MAINYAGTSGVNLLCSEDEICQWIATNIPLSQLISDYYRLYFPFAFTTKFVWPGLNERRVEVGRLFWPGRGASRFAIGHFLATKKMVDTLQPLVAPTAGGLNHKVLQLTQVDDDSGATVGKINVDMYLLPPRPLSGLASPPSPLDQLYLLTFVDSRFFLQWLNAGSLTVTQGTTTWSNLIGQVATNTNLTLTVESVNSAYLKPPAGLALSYDNAATLLDGFSYSVGQGIVFPFNGGVAKSQGSANALSAAQANATLGKVVSGGSFTAAWTKANLPKQIQVVFSASTPYTKTSTVNSLGNSFVATYHHSAVFTNATGGSSAELQALSDQLALDLNVFLQPVCDVVFQGIVNVTPNALQDFEWTYRKRRVTLDLPMDQTEMDATYPKEIGELDDEAGWYEDEVTTRVMPAPYLDFSVPAGLTVLPTSPAMSLPPLEADDPWEEAWPAGFPDKPCCCNQVYTVLTSSSGTFTTGALTRKILVRAWGGGGGGGGSGFLSTTCSLGGGGTSGGYGEKTFDVVPSTGYSYVVGAGGTAGGSSTSGNGTPGGSGGSTTFTVGGTTLTANGGGGGGVSALGSGVGVAAGGTRPGVGTGGDLNADGSPGGAGIQLSPTIKASGIGGSTSLGGGGEPVTSGFANGKNGTANTGGGGSGGTAQPSIGAGTGGTGGSGVIVVIEVC